MPTYEYACKQCGSHLEVVQRFTDDALSVCPSCDGPLRKVFGSIGIAFKGSGFYKNDSRASEKGSKKKEPSAEGASDGSTPKADAPAAKGDGAKSDGGKADGAKGDGAKTAGAKPAPGSSTAAAS